jgi:protein-disulfide isomerase-like protein with CxxC motif
MSKRKELPVEVLDKKEKGFSLTGLQSVRLKEYNALYDPNMKHFFESKNNQLLLYRTGQIDTNGRVIDIDKNKSKLFILEREFKEAEKIEERRQKEELEMRYRVQRKRFNELERLRKLEILQKLKAERELSQEIVATLRMSSTGGFDAKNSLSRSASRNIVVSFGLSFSFFFVFVSKITSYVIIGKCIV